MLGVRVLHACQRSSCVACPAAAVPPTISHEWWESSLEFRRRRKSEWPSPGVTISHIDPASPIRRPTSTAVSEESGGLAPATPGNDVDVEVSAA